MQEKLIISNKLTIIIIKNRSNLNGIPFGRQTFITKYLQYSPVTFGAKNLILHVI